jgi:ribosome-associated toxin RatA of RatAB toxin-antitoxin module
VKTSLSVQIGAPPRRVFELAGDLSRWPEMLPHYRRVAVYRRDGRRLTARMTAVRRFGPLNVPVSWSAEHWADASDEADLRLRFRHVAGVTRGMDVTWHIRPAGAGSSVTIEHVFAPRLPFVGERVMPWAVDRLFVRAIAGRTLAEFRALAEQGTVAERLALAERRA